MKKNAVLILLLTVFVLCCKEKKEILQVGNWRAVMEVSEGQELPFIFSLSKLEDGRYSMEMYNADETIVVDEISFIADTIKIQMPVFEGYIQGVFTESQITGNFIKESLDRVVPFRAFHGERERFEVRQNPAENISGIWETYFSPGTTDEYPAKGIFVQKGSQVTGTFRTTTGDYRYLEGVIDGDSMKLSAFDGAHVFLFTAKVFKDSLEGAFYSGNHFKEGFSARRNEAFELPDANSLTFLKEGYETFEFSFPNAKGEPVSLKDDAFAGKPVVIQILGSWCPNCLDETRFYVDYLKKNPELDVQFLGLAFEYAKTEEGAWKSIDRLRKRIGVPYPILLAQYGSSNKVKANEKLPMLNHVLSYPTTIFIDKQGNVKKIHTGFNGPATGKKYMDFKKDFERTISELTKEAGSI